MNEATDRRIQLLEEEVLELRRAVGELTILNDLARITGGISDIDEILDRVVRSAVDSVGASEGAIFLVEDENTKIETLVRVRSDSDVEGSYRLPTSVLSWMELHMQPIIVNDPANDPRFPGATWESPPASFLAVPMLVQSRMIATLVLFNSEDSEAFSSEDERLLSIISAQSAHIIENARLRKQETELLRMQHEMELASKIQKGLLPAAAPEFPGFEIAGRTTQLESVGGDFYDYVTTVEGDLFVCLGDVSGKGFSASLLMSNVNALLKTQIAHDPSPCSILTVANEIIFQSTSVDRYVTLVALLLAREGNTVVWGNAGHTKPILIRHNQAPSRLEKQEIMLGLTGNRSFTESKLELEHGDLLALFSDGITEATNSDGEEFGEERLVDLLGHEVQSRSGMSAEEIVEKIFSDVTEFIDSGRSQDDMTLVIVRRTDQEENE